jgi:hypothetical protein
MIAARCHIVMIFVALLFISCGKKSTGPEPAPADLLARIQALPDVDAVEIAPPQGYNRAFEIDFMVPTNHGNPSGSKISMKAYLSHIDESLPTVIRLSGYDISGNYIGEVASILGANQLFIGQRYMGEEHQPVPMDWQYLTVEQSAADHHLLMSKLRSIYKGKWISAGTSKGGISATYLKYYYPDELDATIAKVAPFCFAVEDPRLDSFVLNTAGTEECRNHLQAFQRRVLESKDSMMIFLEDYLSNTGYVYSLNHEYILEMITLDYLFTYWQFGQGDCESVPDTSAPAEDIFSHLAQVTGPVMYNDGYIERISPIFYQLFTEIGYYGLITDHLSDLLSDGEHDFSLFLPPGTNPVFDANIQHDLVDWVQTQGENMIFIYGGRDTWSAAAIDISGNSNVIKIVEPGADHLVNIADLTDRETVYSALEQWLDIHIDRSAPVAGFDTDEPRIGQPKHKLSHKGLYWRDRDETPKLQ